MAPVISAAVLPCSAHQKVWLIVADGRHLHPRRPRPGRRPPRPQCSDPRKDPGPRTAGRDGVGDDERSAI